VAGEVLGVESYVLHPKLDALDESRLGKLSEFCVDQFQRRKKEGFREDELNEGNTFSHDL
jgi:hypothetical protein